MTAEAKYRLLQIIEILEEVGRGDENIIAIASDLKDLANE